MAAGDSPFRIRASAVPTIDGLRLAATTRRRPGPGQVEIEVRAVGLNFRDVMSALGSLPGHPGGVGPDRHRVLGPGGRGRRRRLGVLGRGRGGCDRLPQHGHARPRGRETRASGSRAALTHEVAATLPIAFVTAKLALQRLAGLGRGDRVLIHAAAGGVGLAAVQIAQRRGRDDLRHRRQRRQARAPGAPGRGARAGFPLRCRSRAR